MEVRNHTPLRPVLFEGRDAGDRPFYALVARGTYRLGRGPETALVLDTEQAPPVEADRYRGDPGRSSVRVESDLVPPKPRGDLTLDAVARAPGGRPAAEWTAGVRVGRPVAPDDRRRSLVASRSRPAAGVEWTRAQLARVTGPREWARGVLGWRPSPPAPCLAVPLDYEHAFGGRYDVPGGTVHYDRNPVGVGFFDPSRTRADRLPMPQIEDPGRPVAEPGEPYAPVGFGPVGRSWTPRRALAGTYDAAWVQERAPRPPADFEPGYHNAAPTALQMPGPFEGDETVSLVGIDPAGEVVTRLPDVRVWALVRRRSGEMAPVPCQLDTVHFDLASADPADWRASLVWRAAIPLRDPVRVVELRMAQPEPDAPPSHRPRASWRT